MSELRRLHEDYARAENDDSISWQVCSAARGTLKVYLFDHAANLAVLIDAADAVDTDWNADSAKALREALKPFAE